MNTTTKDVYQERVEKFSEQLKDARRKHTTVAMARLAVFVILAIALWQTYEAGIAAITAILFIGAVTFLLLVRFATELKGKVEYFEKLVAINENEISAKRGGYISFDDGIEFLLPDHPYVADLDVFGRGSIYQYVNRTCTLLGRRELAALLSGSDLDIERIKQRQEAVAELNPLLDWRQQFQASGMDIEEKADDKEKVLSWLAEPTKFSGKWYYTLLFFGLPFVVLTLVIQAAFGVLSPEVAVSGFFLQLGIALFFSKDISRYHKAVSERLRVLNKYASLLELIEERRFTSPLLQGLHDRISANGISAGKHFKKLTRILNSFESRQNLLGAIVTNGLFLWDMHNALRLENWKLAFHQDLDQWFDVPASFDALNSLANMAYNRPAFNYPTPEVGPFHLYAEDMGHPLLYEATRIDNDIHLDANSSIILTTGANMAGKSTFLRAVGINLVLAMAGAPVCARSFRFTPTIIYTSMRASDSLLEHESFFYAELVKLKGIIDALEEGQQHIFVLLDEILKGTNSKDQHIGSRALIEQLIRLGASGLVATHDLALGNLEQEYNRKVLNKCFEIAIEDDEMVFDYKFKDGVSQTLNATFLMKKMGITV